MSLNRAEVASFYFYSERFSRDKNFLSLEFHDPEVDKTDIFVFEVLREFKTFAVLTRVGGIKTQIVSNGTVYPYYINNNRVMATQAETVYFFADDGRILPYLKIVEFETEDAIVDWNRTKNKFINKSLFEKFTGPHYPALLQFADEHQLSFKSKEHLVKILDRYAALLE